MLGLWKKAPVDTDKTYDLRYRRANPASDWTIKSSDMKNTGDIENILSSIPGLDPNTDYEVQVRLVKGIGPGGWSDSLVITASALGKLFV